MPYAPERATGMEYNTRIQSVLVSKCRKPAGFQVITAVTTKNVVFWGVCRAIWKNYTDISKEHTASIFRVEEYAQQTTSREQAASTALNGGSAFFRNVGKRLAEYTASRPRRHCSS
jgi:hypothetical protein